MSCCLSLAACDFSLEPQYEDVGAQVSGDLFVDIEVADPLHPEVGDWVYFEGSVAGGEGPYLWHWDFSDGSTSALRTDTHAFEEAGDYDVVFTVEDAQGRVGAAWFTITVDERYDPGPAPEDDSGDDDGTGTGSIPDDNPVINDYVVYRIENVRCWDAPAVYIHDRAGFEEDWATCNIDGGGVDCDLQADKTAMADGFESHAEAEAWLCEQFTDRTYHYWCGEHLLSGSTPYWAGNFSCAEIGG